ncbi:MAG: pyridoxal phosphate-dependent aminotransferase, partial [Leptonema sp. (in: Bacteria)]|nr:pyridoxal phosphate-dependent aminotransferase [Leptonema sp. (in: bacteria)]
DIIGAAVHNDETYAYSPTQGLLETRQFLAKRVNSRGGAQIQASDILFFNGLGDAVSKLYGFLRREARVIGPSPAYPTHSSAEAAHSGYPPITYSLDPNRGWMPDINELYNKVKYNEAITGIMIINPDNPTGAVFPESVLQEILDIARKFRLFVIADEIYINMTYGGATATHISDIVGDLPAISLKGISKEFPWPGGRCGWIEIYNHHSEPMFEMYVKSILNAKMLEVSSTTLPQFVIPEIMSDARYQPWVSERNSFYEKRSRMLAEIFKNVPEVILNPPHGAFYASFVFRSELTDDMTLKIPNGEISKYLKTITQNPIEPDRKFVYQLLAVHNICVVPLTGFVCGDLQGFRCTLLEKDDDKFVEIYTTIAKAIQEFVHSVD